MKLPLESARGRGVHPAGAGPRSSTGHGVEVLTDILKPGVHVALWKRLLPLSSRAWLASVANAVEPFFHECDHTTPACVADLAAPLAAASVGDEHHLLVEDLRALTGQFLALLWDTACRGAFGVVAHDKCRKFHADYVRARLLTTYAGPGTEWVPEEGVCREAMVQPAEDPAVANRSIVPNEALVRRADVGDVLVLKGHLWPGNAARGAVHRSPPVGSQRRLLFVLTANAGHPPSVS